MSGIAPPAWDVRNQLERILASEQFANSDRLSRFLRFAVEQSLAGEGDKIKEYVIGREVFDRGDDYDPRMDPVVRVEARRLRSKLEEYYRGAGQGDRLRIVFRKGSYAPAFETAGAAESSVQAPVRRRWMLAAAAVAAVGLPAVLYFAGPGRVRARTEALAVVPAAGIEPPAPGALSATGLAESLSLELARQGRIPVIAWPEVVRVRASAPSMTEIARELGVNRLLLLSVRSEAGTTRVFAHLVDPLANRTKLWGADYERGAGNAAATERELARAIAEELGASWDRVSRKAD
jgi:TolB-like protein